MNKQRIDKAEQAAKMAQKQQHGQARAANDCRGEIIARLARIRESLPDDARLDDAGRRALAAYMAEHYGVTWQP